MRLSSLVLFLAMLGVAGVARADTVTDVLTLQYTVLNAQQQISFSFADGQVQDKQNPTFYGNVIPNPGSMGATGTAELDFISPLLLKTADPTGLKTWYLLNSDPSGLYTTTPVDPNDPDGLTIFHFIPGVYAQPNSYAQIFIGDPIAFYPLLPIQDVTLTITQTGAATAVTPEPSTLAMLGTGLLGVGGLVRRRIRPCTV